MTNIHPDAKDIAREVVGRVVSRELVLFDQVWDDFLDDPNLSRPVGGVGRVGGPHRGGFEDLGLTLLTTIIIPVVVRVISDKTGKVLDDIIRRIREVATGKETQPPSATLDEKQIRQIAAAIFEVQKSHETESKHGESATPASEAPAVGRG
jgi:hypothetical protein